MNNHMAGFYRSKYKPAAPASKGVARDNENHYMFSTQFESSDARRAFPCFDEPNLKASFDLEIEVRKDLSNPDVLLKVKLHLPGKPMLDAVLHPGNCTRDFFLLSSSTDR